MNKKILAGALFAATLTTTAVAYWYLAVLPRQLAAVEELPPAQSHTERIGSVESESEKTPAQAEAAPAKTPEPETEKELVKEPVKAPIVVKIPAQVNLAVPFIPQAPFKKWDSDHKEFCEEASVAMAASFFQDQSKVSLEAADAMLFKIQDFEMERFGYFEDTNADETVTILKELYHLNPVVTVVDPTANDIKQALAQGKVVLVPAAGRQLGNPHFQNPGPLYHMIVVKGYLKDGRFITNDPGTQFGADYIYSESVLMNAIHDWNSGQVETGRKVVIIVG